jgi:hypothetical protein
LAGGNATRFLIVFAEGVHLLARQESGTLYRHFPTREDLMEAVYRTEVEKLAASGTEVCRDSASGGSS